MNGDEAEGLIRIQIWEQDNYDGWERNVQYPRYLVKSSLDGVYYYYMNEDQFLKLYKAGNKILNLPGSRIKFRFDWEHMKLMGYVWF